MHLGISAHNSLCLSQAQFWHLRSPKVRCTCAREGPLAAEDAGTLVFDFDSLGGGCSPVVSPHPAALLAISMVKVAMNQWIRNG
jgi:hypothetical protein